MLKSKKVSVSSKKSAVSSQMETPKTNSKFKMDTPMTGSKVGDKMNLSQSLLAKARNSTKKGKPLAI